MSRVNLFPQAVILSAIPPFTQYTRWYAQHNRQSEVGIFQPINPRSGAMGSESVGTRTSNSRIISVCGFSGECV